jgi:hypothetical protein
MLRHMDFISRATDPEDRESSTINFVRDLFDVVRYTNVAQNREVMMRPKLHYLASQGRPPQVDICMMYDVTAMLLVVKVDRQSRGFDPEPRLNFGYHCCLP